MQNNSVDFFSPIFISMFLYMVSDNLYKYVETHRPTFERWVDYFITNYSEENFIRWKSYLSLGACAYILVILWFVQIDNYYIFLTIVQTIASAVICTLLEQGMPRFLYDKILTWLHRPRVVKKATHKIVMPEYRPKARGVNRRSLDSIRSLSSPKTRITKRSSLDNIRSVRSPRRKPSSKRIIHTISVDLLPVENLLPKSATPPLEIVPSEIIPAKPLTPPLTQPVPIRLRTPSLLMETIPVKPPTPPLLTD